MISLIEAARHIGGLVLRNQSLKDYKNGPKIIVKKAYIEDGILDYKKRYVVILIQETVHLNENGEIDETLDERS